MQYNIHNERQKAWYEKTMSGMEEANVIDDKNYKYFDIFHDDMVDDDEEYAPLCSSNTEHISFEPQPKHMRKCSGDRKTCSV